MGRKGKGPKDPFDKVSKSEREDFEKLSEEEINQKIATIAKNDSAMEEAKKLDEDLLKIKDQLKNANAPYSEAKSASKQRIAYLRRQLDDKGKPSGDGGLAEPEAAAGDEVERVDEVKA